MNLNENPMVFSELICHYKRMLTKIMAAQMSTKLINTKTIAFKTALILKSVKNLYHPAVKIGT